MRAVVRKADNIANIAACAKLGSEAVPVCEGAAGVSVFEGDGDADDEGLGGVLSGSWLFARCVALTVAFWKNDRPWIIRRPSMFVTIGFAAPSSPMMAGLHARIGVFAAMLPHPSLTTPAKHSKSFLKAINPLERLGIKKLEFDRDPVIVWFRNSARFVTSLIVFQSASALDWSLMVTLKKRSYDSNESPELAVQVLLSSLLLLRSEQLKM